MSKFRDRFKNYTQIFYWVFVFLVTAVLLFLVLPGEPKFKYEYQKGFPWRHDNLVAPFDFAIQKSDERINKEIQEIEANKQLFFVEKDDVVEKVIENYNKKIPIILEDSVAIGYNNNRLRAFGLKFLSNVYKTGFLNKSDNSKIKKKITNHFKNRE